MNVDEYEELLKKSDAALFGEIYFDIKMPSYIDEYYRYYERTFYNTVMIPRSTFMNLDGI